MIAITPLYAGLIALLFVWLSVRVIGLRKSELIGIGDGDNHELAKRIRAHGNCAEYAPLGLLLLAMAELQGAPGWVVHGLGLMLLVGRVAHAVAISRTGGNSTGRVVGMALTFMMIVLAALANIGHALL